MNPKMMAHKIRSTDTQTARRPRARRAAALALSAALLAGSGAWAEVLNYQNQTNSTADSNGWIFGGAQRWLRPDYENHSLTGIDLQNNRVIGGAGDYIWTGGGALFGDKFIVTTTGDVTIKNNGVRAEAGTYAGGGAIHAIQALTLKTTSGAITIEANSADVAVAMVGGGALNGMGGDPYHGNVAVEASTALTIQNNRVRSGGSTARGGAIASGWNWDTGDPYNTVTLNAGGGITVTGNSAQTSGSSASSWAMGGAIWAGGSVTITAGSGHDVKLTDNFAHASASPAYGGAIYTELDAVALTGRDVIITGNYARARADAYAQGGAIYTHDSGYPTTVTLTASRSVDISGNSADMTAAPAGSTNRGDAAGGAIHSANTGVDSVQITAQTGAIRAANNAAVSQSGAYGGAIYARGGVTLTASGDAGAITLSGNSVRGQAAEGGAIYTTNSASTGVVTLTGGALTLTNNTAEAAAAYSGGGDAHTTAGNAEGGAIGATDKVALSGDKAVTVSANLAQRRHRRRKLSHPRRRGPFLPRCRRARRRRDDREQPRAQRVGRSERRRALRRGGSDDRIVRRSFADGQLGRLRRQRSGTGRRCVGRECRPDRRGRADCRAQPRRVKRRCGAGRRCVHSLPRCDAAGRGRDAERQRGPRRFGRRRSAVFRQHGEADRYGRT